MIFYFIGVIAASWHFAYGIWLFCAKWGITTGDNARRKLGYVCVAIGLAMVGMGVYTMIGFLGYHAGMSGDTRLKFFIESFPAVNVRPELIHKWPQILKSSS